MPWAPPHVTGGHTLPAQPPGKQGAWRLGVHEWRDKGEEDSVVADMRSSARMWRLCFMLVKYRGSIHPGAFHNAFVGRLTMMYDAAVHKHKTMNTSGKQGPL
eukprot:1159228-Pelagomonas_calceolata.AAC.2